VDIFKNYNSKSSAVIQSIPWLILPYDSLTKLAGLDSNSFSQTFPLTAIFSIPYIIARNRALSFSANGLRVLILLLGSWVLMFLLAVIHLLFVENNSSFDLYKSIRVQGMLRQSISMGLGVSTYVMFHDSVNSLGLSRSAYMTIIGFVPEIVTGVIQRFQGFERLVGFSTEPSHFADVISFTYIPACLTVSSKWLKRALMLIGFIMLIGAFSTTGILKSILLVYLYFSLKNGVLKGVFTVALIAVVVGVLMIIISDNYVIETVNYMWHEYETSGEISSASFVDRYFGILGPLSLMKELHGWIGYGFGGDSVYFYEMFDLGTSVAIENVKGNVVSISSLQGKIIMYGGVLGYSIFLSAVRFAYKSAVNDKITKAALLAVFLSSIFSMGPMFLPYLWLWLSIATSVRRLSR
jgi:hypothetical protein